MGIPCEQQPTHHKVSPRRDCFCDTSCIIFADCCDDHFGACAELYDVSMIYKNDFLTLFSDTSKLFTASRRRRTALSVSCPCLVFVRIFRKILSGVCLLSGFCPDFLSGVCLSGFCLSRFCPLSGFCPEFCKKSCPMSVCPDSVCLDSVRCPDFVRIFKKNSVRCLSVRPDKDKTELSGLSLSLSADV